MTPLNSGQARRLLAITALVVIATRPIDGFVREERGLTALGTTRELYVLLEPVLFCSVVETKAITNRALRSQWLALARSIQNHVRSWR